MLKRIWTSAVVLVLLALAGLAVLRSYQAPEGPIDTIALLIEDDVIFTDVGVRAWKDAALEEGIHLQPVHAGEFLQPSLFNRVRYAGIIVPDAMHRKMSVVLIDTLSEYVRNGGKLMVAFDAGTLNLKGGAVPERARMSQLVGVEYALYKKLGDDTLVIGPAISTPDVMTALNIPPGKYTAVPRDLASKDSIGSRHAAGLDISHEVIISSYSYDRLEYGHFVTEGAFVGKTLMVSDSGDLLAGVHKFGKGEVLFVNLPLTYLKLRTDGAPLHGFMNYFARVVLQLPVMGNSPDGIGGLIMNWHIDSSLAIPSIQKMVDLGFFEQGPYSIDLTAGPDTNTFNDHVGLNVDHNAEIQKWIKLFVARGDEVGSHGGWIHNYFGEHISDSNETDFAKYIALNNDAISKAAGKPVREYSAPLGNHPAWVSRYLEAHGVRAHYYTGNVGQGPTHSYINGERLGKKIWTFPVLVRGEIATFEEAALDPEVSQKDFGTWLNQVSDFTQDQALIRLVYFHPPGVVLYSDAARSWMLHTRGMLTHGKFRWYTMTRIADFLDRREQVLWRLSEDKKNTLEFTAFHPENLSEQSWRFSKTRYTKPVLDKGVGQVRDGSTEWVIVAGNGKHLKAHLFFRPLGENK
ncbi:polysaccharide deacetylase family protein [Glaciimonas sp. PCH181]|uniref:polysaccharide deacetylase family protein n=1 Tax=Glaciimonas sp. PCH181 TaxID=2133943 RepID=UPI000D3D2548|nr:polysaccharide deacetylase family protein [Glaciimonas sp. PCH181]PUA18822.1 hypothetical protein C7W93_02600 [Glaciimonas sp. PCH181]